MTRLAFSIILWLNIAAYAIYTILGFVTELETYALVGLGHLVALCVVAVPVLIKRDISPFEPYTLFTLYVHIGTLGTSYIIAFGEGRRRDVLMHGDPVEFFHSGALALAAAMLIVGIGYAACNRRIPIERILPKDDRFNAAGLHLVALVTFGIALMATIAFIQSTGGFSFESLSRKRSIEIQSGGEIVFGNAGYLRLAAGLSMSILYVMLANYLRQPYRLSLGAMITIGALLALSLSLPFISSSRATVIYAFLGLVLVYSLYRKISIRLTITFVLIALMAFSAMTGLRSSAQRGEDLQFTNPLIALVQSGNGLSLNGTAHILDGVPERMSYKYGASYLAWLTAPIPRSIWPQKPDVSMGKEIKSKVFGAKVLRSGRPPSVFTEGYINFSWVGFFGVAFLFGYLLRLTANSFLPVLTNSIFAVAIYFPIMLHMAASANAAASQIIVRVLSDTIPVYAIFFGAVFLSFRQAPKKQPLRDQRRPQKSL